MAVNLIEARVDTLNRVELDVREEALLDLVERIQTAPIDTRAALATFKPTADMYQRRVIESRADTIRMVAPAGSGKTQSIINRALERIKAGLHPERILILTFDNAAAAALRDKLHEQLIEIGGGVVLEGLTISTLNAFGYRLLRGYAPDEYRPIVPRDRRWQLFRGVKTQLQRTSPAFYAALPPDIADRYYLEFFSLLKNQLCDPRQPDADALVSVLVSTPQALPFFANASDTTTGIAALQGVIWLFGEYDRALRREGLMDFDDQKLRAYRVLEDQPTLLQTIQAQFDEVIVDEFQDINRLDFVLIQTLAEQATLVVTGDDDQAIYGFRGCSPDFIINLGEHLGREVASYELQTNYRCPVRIVEHADRLIRHNTQRIEKHPSPASPTHGEIHVVSSISAGLEARSIVSYIKRVITECSHVGFNDVAVLYRTNAQSLPLQIEFILNDVPYVVRSEDNLLHNDALQRLLGVLRLQQAVRAARQPDPRDAIRTVEAYFRFIKPHEYEQLEDVFWARRQFVYAIESDAFYDALPKAWESGFGEAINQLLRTDNLLDTLALLSRRFKGLRSMISGLEDAMEEKAPLAEISEVAANFRDSATEFIYVMEEALERGRASHAGNARDDGVSLLTYFKAKGRQWHTVILTTCNEGVIPHRKAPIADERRLFYVGMTRPSSNLLVSFVRKSCNTAVTPSRFLHEAGLLSPS